MAEVAIIECEKQKLGFGEFAAYIYVAILTINRSMRNSRWGEESVSISMRRGFQSGPCVMYKDDGIPVGSETGDVE